MLINHCVIIKILIRCLDFFITPILFLIFASSLRPSHAAQQSDPVGDVIAMELEVKGSTEPYRILLEPYVLFIPGESYIHTTIRKGFKVTRSYEAWKLLMRKGI